MFYRYSSLPVCIYFCLSILLGADRPNVLFIAIDDLRPELGCYGSDIVVSPHLDQLAKEGLRFDRAYCQQAICGPSRASIMTGLRPDSNGVVKNDVYFRDTIPDVVTLTQYFIANGYEALNSGKIYHGRMKDLEKSWSMNPNFKGMPKRTITPGGYAIKENQDLFKQNKKVAVEKYGPENSGGLAHGPAFEAGPVSDITYGDGYNTQAAINTLPKLKENKKPWFIALGYSKPHLPFVAPKKYFDYYDPQKIKLSEQDSAPQNGATVGVHASFEMRTRANIPKNGQIDADLSRKLKHAYYACTSYVDAQIGKMLKALEEQGMRDNTIVVVWGDHGWHLGEYGIWGKATNYEIATRVPLIISTPTMKAKGKSTQALVELLDLYPTLVELCGLEMPKHVEGKSLVKLLDQPDLKWKEGVRSQFPSPALREWAANPLSDGMRQTFFGPLIRDVEMKIKHQFGDQWSRDLFENDLMGYAYRTDRFRFVAWLDVKDKLADPLFMELYDHQNDPHEQINVATKHPELSRELLNKLRAGWKPETALSQ